MGFTALYINMSTPYRENKVTSRFTVQFPDESGIPSYLVKWINLPKYVNGEWSFMGIGLNDVVNPSTSNLLMDILNKKTQLNKIFIDVFDCEGNSIEMWSILVDEVVCADFGELSYDCVNDQEITVTIRPKTISLIKKV